MMKKQKKKMTITDKKNKKSATVSITGRVHVDLKREAQRFCDEVNSRDVWGTTWNLSLFVKEAVKEKLMNWRNFKGRETGEQE